MDKVKVVSASELKHIWRTLAVLGVALVISAASSILLRWSMDQRLAAIVDSIQGAKIVFPPTVINKYAENRYDLTKCMSVCVEKRDVDDASAMCEICLLDAEESGFGCGMAYACEAPTKVSITLPVEKPDAP